MAAILFEQLTNLSSLTAANNIIFWWLQNNPPGAYAFVAITILNEQSRLTTHHQNLLALAIPFIIHSKLNKIT